MKVKTKGLAIKIEDISFEVTCPMKDCGRVYSVTVRKPIFGHAASRCGHGTFYVTITPMQNMVDVNVQFQRADNMEVLGVTISDMTIAGQPYKGA